MRTFPSSGQSFSELMLVKWFCVVVEILVLRLFLSRQIEDGVGSSPAIWRERINQQKVFPPLQNQPFNQNPTYVGD